MKKYVSLFLAIIMALSLVACGGGTKEDAPAPEAETPTPEQQIESGEATYAETVYIGSFKDLDGVDPFCTTGPVVSFYTNATFCPLVKMNTATGELVGVLAESWEDVNGDGTVWRVNLKDGVKYHDGSMLDAGDVKFTWEYAKDPTNVVKVIANADKMVKEVVVEDDLTVRFDLNSPIPDFMTYLELKIYSKEAFDSMPLEEAVGIGCGPYKVGEIVSGVSFAMDRFDDYFEGIDNYPTKTFVFKAYTETTSIISALQAGEIDYAMDVPSSAYNTLKADSNITIHEAPGCMSYYVGITGRKEVWQDVRMRQALAKAINKDDIINVFFEGGIGATRSENFCVPTGAGYDPNVKAVDFDLEGAKALLAECGKEGQEVKIMVSSANKVMAEVIQANLNAAGFTAVIDLVDVANWGELKKTGDYDIFCGDYCSYAGALLYNFDRFFSVGGTSNFYEFESAEFAAALEKVRACTTYEDMIKEFSNLQVWVAENVPLIPVAVSVAQVATASNVGGVVVAPSKNLMEVATLFKTE